MFLAHSMARKVSENYEISKLFAQPIAKTALAITIEQTGYRNRPYKLIVWTEYEDKLKPLHTIFMTSKDVHDLYQIAKTTYEEMNNGNKKTSTSTS